MRPKTTKIFGVLGLVLLTALPASAGEPASAAVQLLQPMQESYAYKQYAMRKKSELSKILYLIDRFTGSPYKVLYDGVEYDSAEALRYVRQYLAKHYKKENAEAWLKLHAYRSEPQGNVIYLKAPDETTKPLIDVLLGELQSLESGSRV
ncbi:MAG TPA: hypothetical protein VL688_12900 [Verrucomicrobiae bacterium]|jgi:hypothetical protein|nr:hypothetical protein [Verrucomicrobiae bacterium]